MQHFSLKFAFILHFNFYLYFCSTIWLVSPHVGATQRRGSPKARQTAITTGSFCQSYAKHPVHRLILPLLQLTTSTPWLFANLYICDKSISHSESIWKNYLQWMGSFRYYLSSRNLSYGHLYSSFTVVFIFFPNSLFGTISIQSHDLGYTGTNAVTRIYSTKG